ncbi:hypothetical protein ACFZBU_47670 [Embleya sp. NPDC008237]|uniref:hypothetical protein n=1 Tax=Embleya sp. NPDC008237 TaxID=3363978 RepID=UPI0036E578A2
MSELDLGLKVASRKLLWRMGYTTRLDVQLRGVQQPAQSPGRGSRGSAAPEAFTDLDVLGFTVAGGFRLQSAIVDCKTSPKGSTSRMFWVRGVADFFDADAAFMVRKAQLTDAARQLTSRLRISALDTDDLARLDELHPSTLDFATEPLSWLFRPTTASESLAAFRGLDKRLDPLLEYREFTYWTTEHHHNPMRLVDELAAVAPHLDHRNPQHLALVFDYAWLYLLALGHAVESVRATHVADLDRGLQEYLFGGPTGLNEKRGLAQLLAGIKDAGGMPKTVDVDLLPPYYPRLRELVVRVLNTPDGLLPTLRLLEFTSTVTALGRRIETPEEMGGLYDGIAPKRAADVVGFLVGSAGLDSGFRNRARAQLLGERLE